MTYDYKGRLTSEVLPQVGWNCLADCFYPPTWFGGIKGGLRTLNRLKISIDVNDRFVNGTSLSP